MKGGEWRRETCINPFDSSLICFCRSKAGSRKDCKFPIFSLIGINEVVQFSLSFYQI